MFSSSSYVSLPAPPPLGKMDHFHVPYPPSPLDLLPPAGPSADVVGGTTDPFDQLPQEVCDQIFSLLSTPALDAARYVSRTWYRRIMTNVWVLRRVLEPGSYAQLGDVCFKSHMDDTERAKALRRLARELDARSRLTSSGNCDEAWRVRYRRCDITFSNPGHQAYLKNGEDEASVSQSGSRRIKFAGISSSGSLVTFVYGGASAGTGDDKDGYSVLVYHIDSTGKPKLVKPIACSRVNGVPINVELSEGGHAGSWVAEVAFSGQKAKHLIRSPQLDNSEIGPAASPDKAPARKTLAIAPASHRDVQRYCSTCCDYHKISIGNGLNVEVVTETRNTADIHPQDDWVHIEKCGCNGDWLILENLPIKDGTELPFYLAKHEQTGNLFIVRIEKHVIDGDFTGNEPDDSFQNLQGLLPIMLLVRPHQQTSYANVAVAPQIMFKSSHLQQVLRIAVLWYEADCTATGKVGLYIYDVVSLHSADRDENGNSVEAPGFSCSGGWRYGTDGNWSSKAVPLPQAKPFEYTVAEHFPIDSDPQQTMKLRGRVSGRRVCGFDRGMGGLHSSLLPSQESSDGSIRLLGDGHKKCMIWGVNDSPTAAGMHLSIIEFGNSWRMNEFWELSIPEGELSHGAAGTSDCSGRSIDRQCACPYHDFGYLVTFPDPKNPQSSQTTENAAMKRKSLLWSFPYVTYPSNRSNAPGQITAFRRYGDVLAERRKELEDQRKKKMDKLRRDELALTRALRDMELNHVQGNQVITSYPPRGLCGLRWKGLFRT